MVCVYVYYWVIVHTDKGEISISVTRLSEAGRHLFTRVSRYHWFSRYLIDATINSKGALILVCILNGGIRWNGHDT